MQMQPNASSSSMGSVGGYSQSTSTAPGKPPVAPPVGLTGNKDADDDILAFYAAKEELLRRQQQEKSAT